MKAIYFTPQCDIAIVDFLVDMSDEELYDFATNVANKDDVKIYDDPRLFAEAFNNGYISDEGYVFFIDK